MLEVLELATAVPERKKRVRIEITTQQAKIEVIVFLMSNPTIRVGDTIHLVLWVPSVVFLRVHLITHHHHPLIIPSILIHIIDMKMLICIPDMTPIMITTMKPMLTCIEKTYMIEGLPLITERALTRDHLAKKERESEKGIAIVESEIESEPNVQIVSVKGEIAIAPKGQPIEKLQLKETENESEKQTAIEIEMESGNGIDIIEEIVNGIVSDTKRVIMPQIIQAILPAKEKEHVKDHPLPKNRKRPELLIDIHQSFIFAPHFLQLRLNILVFENNHQF